jgi:hypothetical protein
MSKQVTVRSFAIGTIILAKKTNNAIGYISASMRCFTPLIMVSGAPSLYEITVIIGKRLAGIYRI